jgi:hypothetical protein
MLGYADTVERAIDDYWSRAARVAYFLVSEAGERLIRRSPIGMPEAWKKKPPANYIPGKFVSNWNLGIGSADPTATSATNIRTVNGMDRFPSNPFGQRFVLSNSSPQALRLELDHWSKQAPEGMVRLTGLEFDPMFRLAVERVGGSSGPREMHRGGYGR